MGVQHALLPQQAKQKPISNRQQPQANARADGAATKTR
jgi:hypothetical protein